MVHGGVCLARHDTLGTVFVEHAIPGELVEARLRFRVRKAWFASVVRAVEPSTQRVTAPCAYVPECGGCQLQHVSYEHQLTLKREVLADALHRQGVAMPATVPVHGMDEPWRYRIRGEFHVVPGTLGVADAGLGFNRSRSWRPIAVDDCLIHDRRITDSLPQLRDIVHQAGTDSLKALHLTAGDDGRELLIHGSPATSLRVQDVDDDAANALGRWSTEWTTLRWRGCVYRVKADTFIQVNWQQMDVLYERVIVALGDYAGKRVVDAYAGVGMLACLLAQQAAEVVCIESNRTAARTGVLNARVNDVSERVRYVPQLVEEALPSVSSTGALDAVILDPPRAGCDRRVTAWLALGGPRRVVYASCDPATLARDLRMLVASGPYTIDSLDVVDMFPQTYHVETVVGLSRTDLR